MCHLRSQQRGQRSLSTLSLLGERYLLLVELHGSCHKLFEPSLGTDNALHYAQIQVACFDEAHHLFRICQLVPSGR